MKLANAQCRLLLILLIFTLMVVVSGETHAQSKPKAKASGAATQTLEDSKPIAPSNQPIQPDSSSLPQANASGVKSPSQEKVVLSSPLIKSPRFSASMLFKRESSATDGTPTKIKIGDFKFEVTLPPGWVDGITGEGQRRALDALADDGNALPLAFVFSNPSSGVVYGTLQVLATGIAFPPSALNLTAEVTPSDWEISKEVVVSDDTMLRGSLPVRFSYSNIRSRGNGLLFRPTESSTTDATWLRVPVTYKNAKGYQSVIIGFYSRSNDVFSSEAISILAAILGSLQLESGESVSIEEYKLATSNPSSAAKVSSGPVSKSQSDDLKNRFEILKNKEGDIIRCDKVTGDCALVNFIANPDSNVLRDNKPRNGVSDN